MQVSVESTNNLERRMTVQVPAERVEKEVDKRLKSMAGQVKIDGFRPGKVPMKVVKQRFGQGVYQDVLGEVVQTTYFEALEKEGLRPAGMPAITPSKTAAGEPIEYTAVFEVYPEIELKDLSSVEIKVPTAEIKDEDIDNMLDNLRNQQKRWEEADKEAEEGDQVVLDFVGRVDGEVFEGGSGEGMPVIIGEGRMIDGFEEQLKGIKKGEERVLKVTFPDEYPSEQVKGKPAEFTVTATAVNVSVLPEIDEEFAKLFGVEDGSVEQLRKDVRENMERELANAVNTSVKNQVMDALLETHDVDVPKALIADEINKLRQQAMSSSGQTNASQFPDEMFSDNAERRVKLGLIIGEIIAKNEIKAEEDRVTKTLEDLARGYEDPQQVIEYYRNSPEQMQSVEGLVLEDQVVDWVKEAANTSEENKTFDEVMNPGKAAQAD